MILGTIMETVNCDLFLPDAYYGFLLCIPDETLPEVETIDAIYPSSKVIPYFITCFVNILKLMTLIPKM